MTNEEWERLKETIRASLPQESSEEINESRRKLDRDMDRLERVLARMLKPDHLTRQRRVEEDRCWQEFERASRARFTRISKIAARSDAKIKALIEDVQRKTNRT